MKRKPEILLLVVSCLCCAIAIETLFYIAGKRQRTYPAVLYQSEEERTMVLCYDEQFLSKGDWDLRLDNPYSSLSYVMNTDQDPSLEGLDPLLVPHAVELKRNAVGFREREVGELNALGGGGEVTLVIGDSFGAGQGVRMADRLTEILEAKLNSPPRHQRHVVANFCMMGFNIRSVGETLAKHGDALGNLRRVVYLFNLNDPARDVKADSMSQSIDDFVHLRANLLAESVDVPVIGGTHVGRWVLERLARQRISHQTIDWYQYIYTDNAGWRETKRQLDQMKRRCERIGCEFIIVLFPLFYELADYPFAGAHEAMREYAQTAGISFIDLLDLFGGRDERSYWVHPRDFHPNHLAHREVAEYLYEKIGWEGTAR